MEYTLTTDATAESALDWILKEQQQAATEEAPAPRDKAELAQAAFNQILSIYTSQMEEHSKSKIVELITGTDADVDLLANLKTLVDRTDEAGFKKIMSDAVLALPPDATEIKK